jgi:hypothetical protein
LNVPGGSYLQKTLSENPNMGPRIEALGLSPKEIHRAESTWQEQKPRNTQELRAWVDAEKELCKLKQAESAETAASSSIFDRSVIMDRYAKARQVLEAKIAELRPAAEKSLCHPDFRMTQEKFSDIQQDEKVLSRIESRIRGLELSRADKLKSVDTQQAADKINRWHDSQIRPLEMTRQKLSAKTIVFAQGCHLGALSLNRGICLSRPNGGTHRMTRQGFASIKQKGAAKILQQNKEVVRICR